MANGKKKYVWLGAAGAALATLLVYVSIFWPPVPRSWVQGAIGKREVYRQGNLTDQDIGVAGTVKVTADDIQKLLQSPEFKALAGSPEFNRLVADPEFQNRERQNFNLTAAQVQKNMSLNQAALSLACIPSCASLLQSYYSLMAMRGFHAMMLNSQFTQMASQSQLSNLAGNAALQKVMASQAQIIRPN